MIFSLMDIRVETIYYVLSGEVAMPYNDILPHCHKTGSHQGSKSTFISTIHLPPAKRSKAGEVKKKRKPKSSLQLIDEFVDEGIPVNEPRFDDEEADMQKAVEESLKDVHAAHRGPLPPVVFREPDSGRRQPLPEVQVKGKEKVMKETSLLDLLTLQTPKKKSPAEQYIFQRHSSAPIKPSGHDESSSLYAELGLTNSETESDNLVVHVGPNLEHIDFEATDASTQQNLEQMDEGFIVTAYPKVQENLKLTVEEQVILEEPASSTGILSSLQHLTKDFSFGDQFFNDKPFDCEMSRQLKKQSSNRLPDSPNEHLPLPATATATATTTTTITTLPLPPQPQQSTTDSILIKKHQDEIVIHEEEEKRHDSPKNTLGSTSSATPPPPPAGQSDLHMAVDLAPENCALSDVKTSGMITFYSTKWKNAINSSPIKWTMQSSGIGLPGQGIQGQQDESGFGHTVLNKERCQRKQGVIVLHSECLRQGGLSLPLKALLVKSKRGGYRLSAETNDTFFSASRPSIVGKSVSMRSEGHTNNGGCTTSEDLGFTVDDVLKENSKIHTSLEQSSKIATYSTENVLEAIIKNYEPESKIKLIDCYDANLYFFWGLTSPGGDSIVEDGDIGFPKLAFITVFYGFTVLKMRRLMSLGSKRRGDVAPECRPGKESFEYSFTYPGVMSQGRILLMFKDGLLSFHLYLKHFHFHFFHPFCAYEFHYLPCWGSTLTSGIVPGKSILALA
ncbi:copia protein [Tanacetum coccineum]